MLLNHDKTRNLGSTKQGNLQLFEDNIGLRAICTVTDAEVIQKAKDKKLKGWSFGQYVSKDKLEERTDNIPRRHIEELELSEVSIIDDRLSPCYTGTSIEQRTEQEVTIDYSRFENIIQKLKK